MVPTGIRLYGLGAIALGAVGIAWGDFALQWQPVAAWFPARTGLAYVFAAALVIAGACLSAVEAAAMVKARASINAIGAAALAGSTALW